MIQGVPTGSGERAVMPSVSRRIRNPPANSSARRPVSPMRQNRAVGQKLKPIFAQPDGHAVMDRKPDRWFDVAHPNQRRHNQARSIVVGERFGPGCDRRNVKVGEHVAWRGRDSAGSGEQGYPHALVGAPPAFDPRGGMRLVDCNGHARSLLRCGAAGGSIRSGVGSGAPTKPRRSLGLICDNQDRCRPGNPQRRAQAAMDAAIACLDAPPQSRNARFGLRLMSRLPERRLR